MPRPPPRGSVDVLDLAERHLQEARAERAERLGVAGAAGSGSRPRRSRGLARPRAPSTCSTWRASARAGGDDRDAAPEHALEHRARRAGSGCSRGSRCRRRPRAAARSSRARSSTTRSSNGKPPWMIGARSGHGDAVERRRTGRRRRSRARRRRSRPSPASPAARRGRCASPPPPARPRAATTPSTSTPSVVCDHPRAQRRQRRGGRRVAGDHEQLRAGARAAPRRSPARSARARPCVRGRRTGSARVSPEVDEVLVRAAARAARAGR